MISVTKNQVCFPLFSNLSLLPNSQLTNRIGKNDLISIPKEIYTEKAIGENPWPGFKSTPERRRYSIQPNDSRTAEGKNFTPIQVMTVQPSVLFSLSQQNKIEHVQ